MSAPFNDDGKHPASKPPSKHAVSVIIPARNEEANIERAVRSVLAQGLVREIVVVDDESTDRTAEILKRLRDEVPTVRTIRVDVLPDGWTGKNYAAWLGANAAGGDWLLFTDADTVHLPGSLGAALDHAEAGQADLFSFSPGQQTVRWWEKSVIPFVFARLARLYRFEKVSDPASPQAAANGQYLLIRRSIYNKIGGHGAVRQDILEDVEIARRVKAAGGRLIFLPGASWVETRMYRSFREMWQGWTKNLYLLYNKDRRAIFRTLAEVWLLDFLLPLSFLVLCILIVAGKSSRAMLVVALLCFAGTVLRQWGYGQKLARLGYDPGLANYQLAGAGLFGLLLLNSVRAYCLAEAVRWKGRDYPVREKERIPE